MNAGPDGPEAFKCTLKDLKLQELEQQYSAENQTPHMSTLADRQDAITASDHPSDAIRVNESSSKTQDRVFPAEYDEVSSYRTTRHLISEVYDGPLGGPDPQQSPTDSPDSDLRLRKANKQMNAISKPSEARLSSPASRLQEESSSHQKVPTINTDLAGEDERFSRPSAKGHLRVSSPLFLEPFIGSVLLDIRGSEWASAFRYNVPDWMAWRGHPVRFESPRFMTPQLSLTAFSRISPKSECRGIWAVAIGSTTHTSKLLDSAKISPHDRVRSDDQTYLEVGMRTVNVLSSQGTEIFVVGS